MTDRKQHHYHLTFTGQAAGPIRPIVQRREPGRNGAPPSPIRADFPDGPQGARDYVVAWKAWLQMGRDGLLTRAERDVRSTFLAEHYGLPVGLVDLWGLDKIRQVASLPAENRAVLLRAFEMYEQYRRPAP